MWQRILASSTGLTVAAVSVKKVFAKSDDYQLDRVVCIARHGARTPLGITRNDFTPLGKVEWEGESLFKIPHGIENTKIHLITDNEKLKSQDFSPEAKYGEHLGGGGPIRVLCGNVKGGQLTSAGFSQSYELGKFLRQKYGIENLEDVYCRSTGFQRTIETMQGIVTGIMPNQTVDVEVASNQNEILIFQSEILKAYPGIAAIRKVLHDAVGEDETNRHLASLANVDFVPKADHNDDGSAPSIPDSVFGVCAIRDDYLSRKANNVAINADCADESSFLMKICALLYRRMFLIWCGRSEEERKIFMPLSMGRLLNFIVNDMNSSKYKRINILTAHDTTIVPLMVALKVPDDVLMRLPPYCAHFEFEFYTKNDKKFIQICYQAKLTHSVILVLLGSTAVNSIKRKSYKAEGRIG